MHQRSFFARAAGRLRMVAVLSLAATLAPSCASSEDDSPNSKAQPEPPQEMRITVTDESYEMPDGLE
jgi:hypothetical protein